MSKLTGLFLLPGFLLLLPQSPEKPRALAVDVRQSKLEIHVYREGFLKAFGHDHLISATEFSGRIEFVESNLGKSSVSFVVEARSLRVVDPDESEKDRQEVQSTMVGEKVLDTAKFPRIQFTSTAVHGNPAKDGQIDAQVEGKLSLHGVEKPVVVPLHLRRNAEGLTADGEVALLQTDYGITPVKVGGGTVRVKDKLKLSFHMVAGADR